jgi:hypothetical protein
MPARVRCERSADGVAAVRHQRFRVPLMSNPEELAIRICLAMADDDEDVW